ncbi:four helix bundle protein [Myroides pelagicus]|uniref:Four helix bundle protein n=1 Tax=Myroides pelagicus TaxID=270914 RepID=A0A7K1GPY7_9FLAO|nr:four helix bundle protein [Myroides pelagicus]
MASGSAHEVEYLLLLSRDLRYIRDAEYYALQNDIVSIKKMFASLINKIKIAINNESNKG